MKKLRRILFPFSWVYALVVYLRNKLFDAGILASKKGALPTLVIGNVHVGGTGKTPHTRFFLDLLSDLDPAVLSRGYGRSSTGYVEIDLALPVRETGDEIRLYKRSHPLVKAAVCENRLEGIAKLKSGGHQGLVILDDAMQHRKLSPDALVALVRADSLQNLDLYLPAGDLRDGKYRLKKADAVVITGWQDHLNELITETELRTLLRLDQSTPMFRSYIEYDRLVSLDHDFAGAESLPRRCILITGIAHPEPLLKYLNTQLEVAEHLSYPDHAEFTTSHLEQWRKSLEKHQAEAVVTTEKDLMRMESIDGFRSLPLYIQPMKVRIRNAEKLNEIVRKKLKAGS